MHRPTCVAIATCLTVATLAACSGGGGSSSPATTTAATTSESTRPVGPLAPYKGRGPAAVGSEVVALRDGRRVVIWYPADAEAAEGTPTASFDIASLLSPQLQSLIPADDRPAYAVDAHPGAEPAAGGPFPVVLFAHGVGGYPEQSVTLTTHLASWGFVVAAPTFVERSLDGLLGTAKKGVAERTDADVMHETLDLVTAEGTRKGSPLDGLVDTGHVAAIGHSAGAFAAYAAAATDPRVDSFISYSAGFDRIGTRSGIKVPPAPDKPGMVMLGTVDGLVPPASSRKVFAGMRTPKYLVEIADRGHLAFTDICLIGQEQGGIIGIAESIKLPIPASFKKLGTDGCQRGALPVEKAFPAINDLTTDFLRWTLGVTPEPAGLDDPAISEQFPAVDIKVTADP